MRFATFSLVLLAGCAAGEDHPQPDAPAPPPGGLELRAEFSGPRTLLAGQQPHVGLKLRNSSATDSFLVVKTGDGSEVGWRDPYVHWTGEIDRGDGQWVPLAEADYGRCGNMNPYGDEDVVRLGPGDELPVEEVLKYEFQQAGKVRLYGHYEYRAGRFGKGGLRANPYVLPSMRGVLPFQVTSSPVVIEVVRPYDLRVKVRKAPRAGEDNRLEEVLDVSLFNRTDRPVNCVLPAGTEVKVRTARWMDEFSMRVTRADAGQAAAFAIRPANGTSLAEACGFGGAWKPERKSVRLRAECTLMIDGQSVGLASEWVDVTVQK